MSNKIERRFVSADIRQSGNDNALRGYAAKFGKRSQNLGGFREKIALGAFDRALSEGQDVRALVNHDPNLVLGRVSSKTLRLSQDSVGLKFDCDLPDTSYARDLRASIQRGDISQCSFAFSVLSDDWTQEDDEETGERIAVRTLRDLDLLDVSAVTYPAYEDTEVYARSLFPDGIPAEVRSRIPNVDARVKAAALRARAARKSLFRFVVS